MDQVDVQIGTSLHVEMLGNLGPQLTPSEQIAIVDVVGLVLARFVGGEVDGGITQQVHICHIIHSIPGKVAARKPARQGAQCQKTESRLDLKLAGPNAQDRCHVIAVHASQQQQQQQQQLLPVTT